MTYSSCLALLAASFLPALALAQSGSNSFHGLYEANVVANTSDIVIYAGTNAKNTCLFIDYGTRRSSAAVFAVNAAGQFSFTIGGQTATGTLTETGFSGSIGGRSFSGTRLFMDVRSTNLQGAYSGWCWDSNTGTLGLMTWIVSPTGKAYAHMDLGGAVDGGTGSMATGGTFNIKSVLDGFVYNNSAPSGDGHFLLTDGVAEGSFSISNQSSAYRYFQVTRKNVAYRLLNVSTRGTVGTGSGVMIGGFVISGGAKRVVIRALGPSLTPFGVAGALADPLLEVYNSSGTLLTSNDNWQNGSTMNQVSGAGLAPGNASEPAVGITLEPGSYTAVVKGVNDTTGVALVEVYEID